MKQDEDKYEQINDQDIFYDINKKWYFLKHQSIKDSTDLADCVDITRYAVKNALL